MKKRDLKHPDPRLAALLKRINRRLPHRYGQMRKHRNGEFYFHDEERGVLQRNVSLDVVCEVVFGLPPEIAMITKKEWCEFNEPYAKREALMKKPRHQ
jgi:hypothetical protein